MTARVPHVGSHDDGRMEAIFSWCASMLGPCEVAEDKSREHRGKRATTHRLLTKTGHCYLKIHPERSQWESEAHAYERWAPVFGDRAPRLLAIRDEEPLALVIISSRFTANPLRAR